MIQAKKQFYTLLTIPLLDFLVKGKLSKPQNLRLENFHAW